MQNNMFQPWVNYLVNHNLTWIIYVGSIIMFIPNFIWASVTELLPGLYRDYKYTLQEISNLKKGS